VATAALPRAHRAVHHPAASDLPQAVQVVHSPAVLPLAASVLPLAASVLPLAALPAVPHLDPTAHLPLEDLVFSRAAVQFPADSRSRDRSRSLQHRSSAERPERMDLSATCATPS
jgi:hypothetical protein